MKRIKSLGVACIATVSVAAWLVCAGVAVYSGGTAQPPTPDNAVQATAAGAAAAQTAGYIVHIDPEMGIPADASPDAVPVVFDEELRNALSTSSEGLVEVPSPVPGGGIMVDLEGRFQNTFVAAVDESGRVGASCTSSLPRDGEPASSSEDAVEGGEGK
jgi:hypothetical protein